MALAQKATPIYPVDLQDRVRAGFYALISRVFYAPPDAGVLDALAASSELVAEAAGAELPPVWGELRRAAAEATPEDVRAEYDGVFIGVGKPDVMLYASYHLTGFLNEKPLAELRSDLAALGFVRHAGASEPEDHISALADVMRHLVLDENNAPADRDAAQQHFFSRHIAPWYGDLCDAIEAAPGAGFYRSVGRMARAFLDLEKASFQIG